MGHHWLNARVLITVPILLVLAIIVSCGGTTAEPIIIEKEVIVEKEVI